VVKQTIKDHATSQVKPHLENYEMGQKTFSWDTAATELVTMFDDEQLNIAYNCVDQHAASKKRDKTALIFVRADHHAEYYSYGDLAKLTNKFANVLTKHAVKKGDRVFVFLPTVPERYVAFLGTLKVGAVAGTMFAAFQEDALLDRLSDSGASVVVTNSELYPRIERICDKLPRLTTVIVTDLETTETTRAATASFPTVILSEVERSRHIRDKRGPSTSVGMTTERKRRGGRSGRFSRFQIGYDNGGEPREFVANALNARVEFAVCDHHARATVAQAVKQRVFLKSSKHGARNGADLECAEKRYVALWHRREKHKNAVAFFNRVLCQNIGKFVC
jgi:hypothetical protein